jgi:ferritin-like metal-binding protein YciE
MPIQSAEDLLVHELHDIEDAEKQASQALERMIEEVENEQLRTMLERRMQEGERVLEAVQSGLQKLNGKSRGTRNEAARGLIQGAEKLLKEVKTPEMKQAVMIAGTQKLEHYCIAAWGTVKAIAREVGEEELVDAMQEALDEGYSWDSEMTELAEGGINPEAIMSGEMDEEEEGEEGEEGRKGGRKSQASGQGGGRSESQKQGGGQRSQSAKGGEKSGGEKGGGEQQGGGRESQSAKSSSGAKKSGGSSSGKSQGGGKSQSAKGGSRSGSGEDSSDLKSREYRDEQGNVHHHTREYMERHGNK